MAVINDTERIMHCKIVYFGPGMGGKTSNLQHIHHCMPPDRRSDLLSIATEHDHTIFFNCQPTQVPPTEGFSLRFHLYAVPGSALYTGDERPVLKGADGCVFIADSDPGKLGENLRRLHDLERGLAYYDRDIRALPLVLQYNKRDLPSALPVEQLDRHLRRLPWQRFDAIAIRGIGVIETFDAVCTLVVGGLSSKQQPRSSAQPLVSREEIAAFESDRRRAIQPRPRSWLAGLCAWWQKV